MQSDPPSLSQSLSASTELARLRSAQRRSVTPSSTSPLTSASTSASPSLSRQNTARELSHARSHNNKNLSNLSLSIGGTGSGSSDEEDAFADVDLGADTALDALSQSDSGMPSLSLRANAPPNATSPNASLLPLVPLALDTFDAETLSAVLLSKWGTAEKDLRTELSAARASLDTELEGTISSCAQNPSPSCFATPPDDVHLDLKELPSLTTLESSLASSEADLRHCSDSIGEHSSMLRALVEELRNMHAQTRRDARQRDHRREVEVPLSALVDDIHVPPNVERALREDKVDSAYVAYIQVFLDKLASLAKHSDLVGGAVDETRAQTTALLAFVCARAHRWLVKRLGVACENVSQWQQRQAALLKYKVLLTLLRDHDKARYEDVVNRYVVSAGGLFTQHYNSILTIVGSCKDFSNSNDLLGTSDYSIFSFFGAKYSSQRPNLYSIETRKKTLHQLDYALELPEPGKSLPEGASFEFWFRGAHFEFVTLLLKEYRFCMDLFQTDLSMRIFSVCAGLFQNTIQTFASNSFDLLSLVVLAIVISKHREMMLLRLPPAAFSQYFTEALASLKARSFALCDQHIASLNTADANSLRDVDPRAPHYVTRRFAELYSSLLVLRQSYGQELGYIGLDDSLTRMRSAGIQLMVRLADSITAKTSRTCFLVNNLDMTVSVLANRGLEVGAYKILSEKLDEALKQLVTTYLHSKFPEVLSLSKSLKQAGSGSQQTSSEISRLIDSISKWKTSSEQIHTELQGTLANIDIGAKILLQVLDSVSSLYSAIHDDIMARKSQDITQIKNYLPPNELRYAIRRFEENIGAESSK